jgi:hypothetical protein
MEEKDVQPLIDLSSGLEHSAGLIIPYPSGVLYANQVGGKMYTEIEGVFVPLNIVRDRVHIWDALRGYFAGGKYGLHHPQGIDTATADFLDEEIFAKFMVTPQRVKVDRDSLEKSPPAWIYVTLSYSGKRYYNDIHGFKTTSGIFTWHHPW